MFLFIEPEKKKSKLVFFLLGLLNFTKKKLLT